MSRRALLKTIAFICGLYFFLEFVLPEKIGGEFDSAGVHSPVRIQTPDGPVILYVGQYNNSKASVGRLEPSDAAGTAWRRSPDTPVMQRTLYVPYEKYGMRQLDAVTDPAGIDLFYLGLDKQQRQALCHAWGDPSGKQWKRTGAVLFSPGGAPRPTVAEPNGELPGDIAFFAAGRSAAGWEFLLALNAAAGLEVWPARGGDLKAVELGTSPLIAATNVPPNVSAFDARLADGLWTVQFVNDAGVSELAQQAGGAFASAQPRLLTADGAVTELRLGPQDGAFVIGCRKSSTNRIITTEIMAGSLPGVTAEETARTVKSAGREGQTTYLSQGTATAANYLQIIGSFAIFIALINLTMYHGKRIVRLQKGSIHSVIFFAFTIAMTVIAYIGQPDAAANTDWKRSYNFIFEGVLTPMGTAVFSMITFYMISAAYRSFRVRSLEAALLMVAACIVMIGQMPIGALLTSRVPGWLHCLQLPWLAEKLLWIANACAYRGVLIGIAVGAFSIGLRVWLGLDNTVYSGMEEKK